MPVPPLNYRITERAAAPDDLPVTIAEAREYLVLGSETDRDSTIRNLIITARDWIEDACRTILVPSTVIQKYERFGCGQYEYLPLAREPVREITEITYVDEDEDEQTWDDENWKLELGTNPPGIYLRGGKIWPTISGTEPWPISVEYEAGPAIDEPCRGGFRDAVLLLLTFRHEFPSGIGRNGADLPLPAAVRNLISPNAIRGYH